MPVGEKELLSFVRRSGRDGFRVKELARQLQVPQNEMREFRRLVRRLQQQGKLARPIPRDRLLKPGGSVEGRIQGTRRHFAFLVPEEGPDLYLRPENMADAIHGDWVRARVRRHRGRLEGIVETVLKRNRRLVSGTLEKDRDGWFLVADEERILRDVNLSKSALQPAARQAGHKALVRITGDRDGELLGEIETILGEADKPGVRTQALLAEFDLAEAFPAEVLREIDGLEPPSPELCSTRDDHSALLTFTIDPADAKDHDDALSIQTLENGEFRIGVHIADVAHYVPADSALDREAEARGTSVYLKDRVVPMLPELLSNHVCSLRPGVPRLSISVFLTVDRNGELLDWRLSRGWIVSRLKMSYTAAQALVHGNKPPEGHTAQRHDEVSGESSPVPEEPWSSLQPRVLQCLQDIRFITGRIRKRRIAQGALEIETPEYSVQHDRKGRVVGIEERQSLESHHWVEELMLLANQAVARSLSKADLPLLWRVHEEPEFQKVEDLRLFLRQLGVDWQPDEPPTHKDYERLLRSIRSRPESKYLMYRVLRSLQKARYVASHRKHFGLAFTHYTHFTSPIRRYPDLYVHRLLHAHLESRKQGKGMRRGEALKQLGAHTSNREILAADAERASLKLKTCEWLQGRVGEQTDGYVSSIHDFGVFVDLPEWRAEGFVSLENLPADDYSPDPQRTVLQARHSGRQIRFGQRLRLELVRVDPDRRQIDLCMVSTRRS